MYLRNPVAENYSLTAKKGFLSLRCAGDTISSDGAPSYVCLRQRHFSFRFETALDFAPADADEQAGIVILQNTSYHYTCLAGTDGSTTVVTVVKTENGESQQVGKTILDAPCHSLLLRLDADGQDLSFSLSEGDGKYTTIAEKLDGRILCTDAAGGFVGNTIGIYATANGKESQTFAAFDYIEYTGA